MSLSGVAGSGIGLNRADPNTVVISWLYVGFCTDARPGSGTSAVDTQRHLIKTRRYKMQLTPDQTVVFTLGQWQVNATIVNTWIVMILLAGISMLVARNLRADKAPGRWRSALELIVTMIQGQIEEVTRSSARHVLYFAGTLFLFIAASNVLTVIPGFVPPTSSLSTTVALTLSVLVAIPLFELPRGCANTYANLLNRR